MKKMRLSITKHRIPIHYDPTINYSSRYGGSDDIKIDLEAYVTQDELNILSASDELYISSPTQWALDNPRRAELDRALLTRDGVEDPSPYYHSRPLDGSQAFGKFSFKGARESYHLKCEHCSKELTKPEDGRIFKGSVFMAKVDDNGPTAGLLNSSDIESKVYCVDCVRKVLYL